MDRLEDGGLDSLNTITHADTHLRSDHHLQRQTDIAYRLDLTPHLTQSLNWMGSATGTMIHTRSVVCAHHSQGLFHSAGLMQCHVRPVVTSSVQLLYTCSGIICCGSHANILKPGSCQMLPSRRSLHLLLVDGRETHKTHKKRTHT